VFVAMVVVVRGLWSKGLLQIFLFLFFIRHLPAGYMRLLPVFAIASLVGCRGMRTMVECVGGWPSFAMNSAVLASTLIAATLAWVLAACACTHHVAT